MILSVVVTANSLPDLRRRRCAYVSRPISARCSSCLFEDSSGVRLKLAFGVSDEGSERPAVGQAAGTDVRFTITGDCCGQPLLGSARRGRVHAPELGDPGAFRLEVIKGCWAQDRTGGRTSLEKVRSTHNSDEFAGRPWSVLT